MYGRNRGNWYQAAFWLITGVLLGQFLRFDINLTPRKNALPAQAQIAQINEDSSNG